MTDDVIGPVIVTVADGSLFWCEPERVNEEFRWVFQATNGARYVGPPASSEVQAPPEVQRIVEKWYSTRAMTT
jgi:hypothetical protein